MSRLNCLSLQRRSLQLMSPMMPPEKQIEEPAIRPKLLISAKSLPIGGGLNKSYTDTHYFQMSGDPKLPSPKAYEDYDILGWE